MICGVMWDSDQTLDVCVPKTLNTYFLRFLILPPLLFKTFPCFIINIFVINNCHSFPKQFATWRGEQWIEPHKLKGSLCVTYYTVLFFANDLGLANVHFRVHYIHGSQPCTIRNSALQMYISMRHKVLISFAQNLHCLVFVSLEHGV